MKTTRARSPTAVPAAFVEVMKAKGVDVVPGGHWHCEIKYDGYRAVAVVNQGKVELWSRARQPLTADYPQIVSALARLKCRNATLDGEIVALDEAGRSRFELLQARDDPTMQRPIVYFVFDVMHRDGRTLTGAPIEERRAELEDLLRRAGGAVQLSAVVDSSPADLLAAARRTGLEGIIAKRRGSTYEAGGRSGAWLKCKVFAEQEFVIGGYTAPRNSRTYFGAILVGYYERGRLRYAGKVGSGFDRTKLRDLHTQFQRLARSEPPFVDLPVGRRPRFGTGLTPAALRQISWIEPRLVAQVRFAEWTREGLLRQPVFLGLRRDKKAKSVRREAGPVKNAGGKAD